MQTFVPYESNVKTASVLDDKRLFKQIVESRQILESLLFGGGWRGHPATRMWEGYEVALVDYTLILCIEWEARGMVRHGEPYRQSFTQWLTDLELERPLHGEFEHPWWWGGPIHYTHKLKLLWKKPEWYSQRFHMTAPKVEPAYFWPVRSNNGRNTNA